MLSNFFVALGGVVPLFCLMAVGVFVKRSRLLSEEELLHMNRMVFRVFFFFMMFYNIYISDPGTAFQPLLMLFGAGGVLLTALVFTGVVCRIEPDNARRGPMIQAVFRGNYVLMGIPLVSNIFGDAAIAVPTMMIAVIVPLYNVLGVLVLETFRGGRFDLLPILRSVLMNPMILGAPRPSHSSSSVHPFTVGAIRRICANSSFRLPHVSSLYPPSYFLLRSPLAFAMSSL